MDGGGWGGGDEGVVCCMGYGVGGGGGVGVGFCGEGGVCLSVG